MSHYRFVPLHHPRMNQGSFAFGVNMVKAGMALRDSAKGWSGIGPKSLVKAALAICHQALLTFLFSLRASRQQLQTRTLQLLSEVEIFVKTSAVTLKYRNWNLPLIATLWAAPPFFALAWWKCQESFSFPPALFSLNTKLLWCHSLALCFSLRACV